MLLWLVLNDDSRGHSRESGNPEKDQAEPEIETLILRTLLGLLLHDRARLRGQNVARFDFYTNHIKACFADVC